jgi:transcriptional antiterminator RfaH
MRSNELEKKVRAPTGTKCAQASADCSSSPDCAGQQVLKLSDNPPALSLGQATSLSELPGTWWVAHTKARFEKAFAFDLLARDIHYFLPYMERVRFSGGRNRRVLLPLFSSYVFFAGDDEARVRAIATGRLCQVIPVRDQAQFVGEITAIAQAMRGGVSLSPYPDLPVGQRCRVTAGPLEDFEGVVVRQAATARLVLQVRMLGQGALVEIDAGLLEPIDVSDLRPEAPVLAGSR